MHTVITTLIMIDIITPIISLASGQPLTSALASRLLIEWACWLAACSRLAVLMLLHTAEIQILLIFSRMADEDPVPP